ncbi:MAG: JAB domain-containing protein [Acidobacteriota bacterium]
MSPAATADAAVVPFPVPTAPRVARRRLAHDERPAVRLRHHGAHTLSDSELVALLTRKRVGSDEDLHGARALLRDGLASLVHRVLSGAADIPHDDARRLAAAIELGRRSVAPPPHRALYSLESAGRRLAARYAGEVQERLGALLLDARGRIIAEREVFVGTLHTALVSTRDVLRLALSQHAKGVVVFHNHPSGDTQSSDEDVAYTRRLASAAQLLDVELVDHLVLAGDRHVSMKYRGDF